MKKSKSVTERLEAIKLQSGLNKSPSNNTLNGNSDEYPKMRRPRPSTLAKIRGHQKSGDVSKKVDTSTEGKGNVEVPLRQEFINKKEQLEMVAASLVKKFELQKKGKLLNPIIYRQDSDAAQSLHKEPDLQLSQSDSLRSAKKIAVRSLNESEQFLVNIFYTKIKAHPNGMFAESLPHWYKKTFDKDLNLDWLELLQASNQFDIEEVQKKIVLYTKGTSEDPRTNTDLNAYKPNVGTNYISPIEANGCDSINESSASVARYKHLQISLQEYVKKID